jgi:hypothetical protein
MGRSSLCPVLLLAATGLALAPRVPSAQDIDSVAVQYIRPPAIGAGATEIATSILGAGFHFDPASRSSRPELATPRTFHLVSGGLAISRTALAGYAIGALAGAKTMTDVFWAISPSYLVLGALDVAGAVVALSPSVEAVAPAASDSTQVIRSRTINQEWGVSMAILAGVEFAIGIASMVQVIEAKTATTVFLMPTPGGIAISGRFGTLGPKRRM